MSDTFLTDLIVVEFGDRVSVGLCGALLQRLGAEVIVVETPEVVAAAESKWPHRALLGAGKHSVIVNLEAADDVDYFGTLLERADIVVTSSDWRPRVEEKLVSLINSSAVICDVSAFGTTGPLAGERYTDSMMQAFAGLIDTTGMPDAAPLPTSVPITECTAAVFATAGVLAALRSSRASPRPHRVEVAMFDTAVSMLSTFLPTHFTGGRPRRMGNRHPSMSPWNAYPARDGWLLLCSASDEMWGRVCEVVGQPELRHDPRFGKMTGRVQCAAEADAAIEPWIARHTVHECMDVFNAAAVPCGPVSTIAEVLTDASLRARGAFCRVADSVHPSTPLRDAQDERGRSELLVPGRLIHGAPAQGRVPEHRLTSGSDRRIPTRRPERRFSTEAPQPDGILGGVRVVEMGSYTTAPLAARNLGALGAYVVKAEPPSGELSRASPPHSEGQSYFTTISNSDKRCVAVDLRTGEGRALFRDLLSRADVFVENMKPGVLERYGFGPRDIRLINPRLVYCSVSGYGASSPLADRSAMDTTIQGTAGVMDLTRGGGVPFKVGISISDILGGQFALLAILAGLEYRSRTGNGQFIDLSMQELSAWLTQFFWNGSAGRAAPGRVIPCRDGYVYAVGDSALDNGCADKTKSEAVSMLTAQGVRCAPVNTVSEVASHAQTAARELIVERPASNGKTWPLLACPIRLAPFPAVVRRAIGGVGEDLQEVLRDWDLA